MNHRRITRILKIFINQSLRTVSQKFDKYVTMTLQGCFRFFFPEKPICVVEEGTLIGKKDKDIEGVQFVSFMGIPYSKPPTGILRFKSPQPPEIWKEARCATKHGGQCYALNLMPNLKALFRINFWRDFSLFKILEAKAIGSEDCLFLNVYTRKLFEEEEKLRPVMVFIHGGAFISGSGNRRMYGPEFLLTEDIVLVTVNYRLGALGFASFDDTSLEATGNTGLKDQIQALRWVQKNIKCFGGDPKNVTIFGQSAGGASVHYLVLSPLSKGLFHKAIIQSGSVLCPWARSKLTGKELFRMINLKDMEPREMLQYLQNLPKEDILDAEMKLRETFNLNFAPRIEPKIKNAFLSDEPINLINSGNYNQVPLMIGYTSLEGSLEEIVKHLGFPTNLDDIIPFYAGYPVGSDDFQKTNKKLLKYYFGEEKADASNLKALYTLLTDSNFIRGIHLAVKGHAKTCTKPIYYYRISIETKLNIFKRALNIKEKGVCHGDDLGYLFKVRRSRLKKGSLEEISSRRFVKMWTNFAKTGNPIPQKDSLLNSEWKPVTTSQMNFLDIGSNLVAGIDPESERMEFWDELCEK